ncbi:MAG: hypothetical protein WEE89_05595 [Gemmatimonadota bacterium]
MWILDRRSYAFDKTERVTVVVDFAASEWDRDIFGKVYADERLSGSGEVSHVLSDLGWSRLGTQYTNPRQFRLRGEAVLGGHCPVDAVSKPNRNDNQVS